MDKEKILNLKEGEVYIIPEFDYGKAEIWLKNSNYFLFEIPMYGGEPIYYSNFSRRGIDSLLEVVNSWN